VTTPLFVSSLKVKEPGVTLRIPDLILQAVLVLTILRDSGRENKNKEMKKMVRPDQRRKHGSAAAASLAGPAAGVTDRQYSEPVARCRFDWP
jgi:hypothetical protein